MSFTDPPIADYYDKYEIESELSDEKIKQTRFVKWKKWFNDLVRLQIINFVIMKVRKLIQ